jgi:hypothetical protein
MGAEINDADIQLVFEGMKEIGLRAMVLMGSDFEAEAVQEAPIKTGNLRSSIQATTKDDYMWIVGTNLEYAPYVHEGTEPHVIEGNPWLYWPGAEHPVRKVNHPGTEANPFFDRATDTVEGRLDEYIQMAMEDVG